MTPGHQSTLKKSKSTSSGCLITFIFLFAVVLICVFTCSRGKQEDVVEQEQTADPITPKKDKNDSLVKGKTYLATLHSKVFNTFDGYSAISDYSLDEISEIYHYLSVERWNLYGLNEPRETEYYKDAAETLNIPVSKLEAADRYYYYVMLSELDTAARKLCTKYSGIIPDYYSPIQSTAYCGLRTFIGSVQIYGHKSNSNLEAQSRKFAENFISALPEWVTGVKLYATWYKDTILETEGSVDVGFLWRRGEEIQTMRSSGTGYPGSIPTRCEQWGSDPWNNLKSLRHPNYRYINPKTASLAP